MGFSFLPGRRLACRCVRHIKAATVFYLRSVPLNVWFGGDEPRILQKLTIIYIAATFCTHIYRYLFHSQFSSLVKSIEGCLRIFRSYSLFCLLLLAFNDSTSDRSDVDAIATRRTSRLLLTNIQGVCNADARRVDSALPPTLLPLRGPRGGGSTFTFIHG